MPFALLLVCLAAAGVGAMEAAGAELWARGDIERYRVILQRMPFGAETPLAAVVAPSGPPAVEPFAKFLRMTAITENERTGQIQVGLIDTRAGRNYFMAVGEIEDGMTLEEADYAGERALIRKGEEQYWISMNDPAAPVAVAQAVGAPTQFGMQAVPGPQGPPAPFAFRRNRVRRQEVPELTLTGEALEKKLQEYQMELIRAGGAKGPPLPMPLTPEMDAQLVAEGVLSPPGERDEQP